MLDINEMELSLQERLKLNDMQNGIFHFRGDIDKYNTEDFLMELTDVCAHPKEYEEITIRMTSPGGHVYEAFCIYDILRNISSKGVHIKMIVEGIGASAAAMILLQAADERISLPNTSFLLHEPKRWIFMDGESKSELEDEATEMKRIADKIMEILSLRCNKSKDEINELIERREVWMSAEQALEWNLIDKII